MKDSRESIEGGTNGSMADTSTEDLERGYSMDDAVEGDTGFRPIIIGRSHHNLDDEDEELFPHGGFAGRSRGFER